MQTFHPKKEHILGLGPGCGTKPKTKINSEFYIFWYRNQHTFKIINTLKFKGSTNCEKNIRKFLEKFFKNFQKSQKIIVFFR